MKESEIFLKAQKAVIESSLPKHEKLEILGKLMDEVMLAKLLEDAEAKEEANNETI